MTGFGGADGIYLDRLGVAVTAAAPTQFGALSAPAAGADRLIIERERVVHGFHVPQRPRPSMGTPSSHDPSGPRGLDVAVGSRAPRPVEFSGRATNEAAHTWGLVCTNAATSSKTGRGIRVAVLDTGLDLNHPDFAGRAIVSRSFIEDQAVQDGYGHGTHCVGTALGPARPGQLPRYGIACEASMFVGKVLDNNCSGRDGSVLAGIDWALAEGCRVISMSLGTSFSPGDRYSRVHETVAQRALAANSLLIAAAGNESDRANNRVSPVGHPANCPSIMAVGAVDADMRIADFSCRGSEPNGGDIDIVGPGVAIYSTLPLPKRYERMDGTSMACPHVAGIAALYMEAHPTASARDIWTMLTTNAKKLALDVSDMGAGLVQAPA